MTAETPRFDDVDFATWCARVEKAGASVDALTHAGLDGIEFAALYAATPTQAMTIPPRAGGRWSCLQQLPQEPVRARAVAATLVDAQVDGVWIDGRDASVIAVAVPHGLALYVESDTPPTGSAAVAWCGDPCAPSAAGLAAARLEAAFARSAARPLRTWLCDGTPWHDAGATAVDEIAIVIAGVLGALRTMGDHEVSAGAAASSLLMRVGLGGDILVDVAKLRALRGLWHACATQLGVPCTAIPVHARTCRRLRSRLDADTNLVRATYELFAAATAGVDALVVEPHDRDRHTDDVHRWAHNLAHLMRHESRLDVVDDPFAGAWAVESITRALAGAAWTRVQQIEKNGGLAALVASGSLQRETVVAAAKRRAAIAEGKHPIVGVSKFPPPGRPVTVPAADTSESFGPLDLCRPYEGGAS